MTPRLRQLFTMAFLIVAAGAEAGNPGEGLAEWVDSATAGEAMAALRGDLTASVERGAPVSPSVAVPWPSAPTGVFVSLLRDGTVAGCMGSFEAPAGDLYAAALRTAWRATREDVRSRPLRAGDLVRLEIVVTFVGHPISISDPDYLSPWKEGLLAVQGDRTAVVVPGEARTTRYAVSLALRNSGIDPEAPIQYSRFEAVTWREGESHAKTRRYGGIGVTRRRRDPKEGYGIRGTGRWRETGSLPTPLEKGGEGGPDPRAPFPGREGGENVSL